MQKNKVAFLIQNLAGGGAERQASVLLNNLHEEYDVHLVLLDKKIDYAIPENQEVHYIANYDEHTSFLTHFLKLPLLGYRYYKYCKKNKIDISFSFNSRPNWIATFNKILGNKHTKVVLNEVICLSKLYSGGGIKGRLGRFLTRFFYKYADAIVANSKLIKTDLEEFFKIPAERLHSVYNPVDLRFITSAKKEPVNPHFFSAATTFVCVARFDYQKNHVAIIDAFSKIKEHDFKLLLVGTGRLYNEIFQQVKDNELSDKVEFLGFQKNPFNIIAASDCFVLFSHFEGFPNALQESMACETPIISADCETGPRELLAPQSLQAPALLNNTVEMAEYGILVPPGNVDLLVEALVKVMNDKQILENYRIKSRERSKVFDVSIIKYEFIKIFEKLTHPVK